MFKCLGFGILAAHDEHGMVGEEFDFWRVLVAQGIGYRQRMKPKIIAQPTPGCGHVLLEDIHPQKAAIAPPCRHCLTVAECNVCGGWGLVGGTDRHGLHVASIMSADFEQGVGDLTQRADAHRLHQHFENVVVVYYGLAQTCQCGGRGVRVTRMEGL